MMKTDKRALRRKAGVTAKIRLITGGGKRMRLSVRRSNNHIYAQVIDDLHGKTLAAASSLDKTLKLKNGGNKEAAQKVGAKLAERAIKAGVGEVAFDRGGYAYHGRVHALAQAVREGGLKF